jgi:hypothetical protein
MSNDTNDRGESPTVQHTETIRHSWEEPFHPSVTIVEAVAAATDRTPENLPPLQDRIDPDALDSLITRGEPARVAISFEYADTVVVVKGNGAIEVRVDPIRR